MTAPLSYRRHSISKRPLFTGAVLLLFAWLAPPLRGQEAGDQKASAGRALRVFFDCNGPNCDFDFYRREIPFVNYTRDRNDAQVHVLITSERTGSRGRRFTLDFIGREQFEGLDDRLEVVTRSNLASEQALTQVAAAMKLGLLRYVARTDQAADIQVLYDAGAGEDAAAPASPEDDPWNFWTFRVRGNGNVNIDERTKFYRVGGGISASRITDALKLVFSVDGNYNKSVFETSDSTSVTSTRDSYDIEALNVWSLTEHWSFGASYQAGRSSFNNEALQLEVGPAIEYNIFPYSESTRRQFNILYTVGVRYNNYIEETVFLKTRETLPQQSISASVSVRQPWGGTFGSLEFSQFFEDLSKNRFNVFLGADFRLFRGLSFNVNGSYSRVRDQVNVPAGDATDKEVLLRQRILQSGFRYAFSVGFSYTFGSIFSNVVNPRLESL